MTTTTTDRSLPPGVHDALEMVRDNWRATHHYTGASYEETHAEIRERIDLDVDCTLAVLRTAILGALGGKMANEGALTRADIDLLERCIGAAELPGAVKDDARRVLSKLRAPRAPAPDEAPLKERAP